MELVHTWDESTGSCTPHQDMELLLGPEISLAYSKGSIKKSSKDLDVF